MAKKKEYIYEYKLEYSCKAKNSRQSQLQVGILKKELKEHFDDFHIVGIMNMDGVLKVRVKATEIRNDCFELRAPLRVDFQHVKILDQKKFIMEVSA